MQKLPKAFLESIKDSMVEANIEEQYDDFKRSFEGPVQKGLRINRLKVKDIPTGKDVLDSIFAMEFPSYQKDSWTSVKWCQDGFYTPTGVQPGRSIAQRLGLYYIQEPSAMLPAELLRAKASDLVIDLCAAPGGKSARIAADLAGKGLLVSNDISSSRGRILVRNLEQLGVKNAIVTAADPVDLAARWPGQFDKVLVDAPCSGEGMFRRDPKAKQAWIDFGPDTVMPIQAAILDAAVKLLKPGGTLVYATCTFNRKENEAQIEALLSRHENIFLLDGQKRLGVKLAPGLKQGEVGDVADKMLRLWPQLEDGEGHFCAVLEKQNVLDQDVKKKDKKDIRRVKLRHKEALEQFFKTLVEDTAWPTLKKELDQGLSFIDDRFHLVPDHSLDLKKLHILKEGVYLANLREGRKVDLILPTHSAALIFKEEEIKDGFKLDLKKDDERIWRLLKGETIELDADEFSRYKASIKSPTRGHILLFVEGYPMSWIKLEQAGIVKNLYPAGWRVTYG